MRGRETPKLTVLSSIPVHLISFFCLLALVLNRIAAFLVVSVSNFSCNRGADVSN